MPFSGKLKVVLMAAGIVWSATARTEPSWPAEFWWYWDRPAAKLPAPAPGVGAAVVVTHVLLSGAGHLRQTRRSALLLPEATPILPVVHVEIDHAQPFVGTTVQRDALRDAVVNAASRGNTPWVQLDFEVRRSEREFWRASVEAIKVALPKTVRLSVTALASWCYGDRWLGDIPVDEVVPMYFRLGRTRPDYEARSAATVPEPRCAQAHGLADDEPPWPQALPGRRYLFLGHRTRRPLHTPTHQVSPCTTPDTPCTVCFFPLSC